MSLQEIDDFLSLPGKYVAWNEVPYPITAFRWREMKWAIHRDGVDTGFHLVVSYPPTNTQKEFGISLRRKFDFCRLDMRPYQRSISMNGSLVVGPSFVSWVKARDHWHQGGKYGHLPPPDAAPTGTVTVMTALDWFLTEHGISTVGMPKKVQIGR